MSEHSQRDIWLCAPGATPKIVYTWNPIGIGRGAIREHVKLPAQRGSKD